MLKSRWPEAGDIAFNRRSFMRRTALFGSVVASSWLIACGSDSDDDSPTSSSSGSSTRVATLSAGASTVEAGSETPAVNTSGTATSSETEAAGKQGGTLRLGFGEDQIPTLDPAQSHDSQVAGQLIANLFSCLVQFDKDLNMTPDLAEKWDISDDGLTYTFHLREGLKYHNGDSLTADDFIYTYKRTIDKSFASSHASKLASITEASAPDPRTFVLKMSSPFAPFLAIACVRGPGRALAPISKRAIDELGNEQFGVTPVGTGPFKIVPESTKSGQGFEMVAFEDWYGGRPFLDKIVVQLIPEPSSQVNALDAGDIDMLSLLLASGVEQVKANDELVMVSGPGTNWRSLAMNTKRKPWDNPKARMAVAKAINRKELIEKAFFGLATECIGPIQPAFGWAYLPPEKVDNPQAYDLDAAKRLAEEAGLDGVKPVLIITADDQRPAEVLRIMLQEIGLDVKLELVQNTVHTQRETAGDFDFSLYGSGGDADPDDSIWDFFHSTGPRNITSLNNTQVDQLLEQSRAISDQAQRAKLFQQIQAILEQEANCAFTRHVPDSLAFHKDVKGYLVIPEVRYLESVWLDR